MTHYPSTELAEPYCRESSKTLMGTGDYLAYSYPKCTFLIPPSVGNVVDWCQRHLYSYADISRVISKINSRIGYRILISKNGFEMEHSISATHFPTIYMKSR